MLTFVSLKTETSKQTKQTGQKTIHIFTNSVFHMARSVQGSCTVAVLSSVSDTPPSACWIKVGKSQFLGVKKTSPKMGFGFNHWITCFFLLLILLKNFTDFLDPMGCNKTFVAIRVVFSDDLFGVVLFVSAQKLSENDDSQFGEHLRNY